MSDHGSRILAALAANPHLQDLVRAAQEHPGVLIVTCAENAEQAEIRRKLMEAGDPTLKIEQVDADPKLSKVHMRRAKRR